MNRALWIIPTLMIVATIWFVAGCESSDKDGAIMADTGNTAMAPPFGGPIDVSAAKQLWRDINGYQQWNSYPGLGGWQDGNSPHGKVLKYFINQTAQRSPANPRNGYIIIKENYGERNGPLMAVTVMKKQRGYDPDNADWFWVKYNADGTIAKNPAGMQLAGRVAKGMPKGCIACHGNAGGDDYLFIND